MTGSDPLAFIRNFRKGPSGRVSMKVSNDTRNIRKVSSRILSGISAYNIEENRIFDIRLCIEEAVRNAMVHGNRSDKKKTVKAAYWVENGYLCIEVEDEGAGFDHSGLVDPTIVPHILKDSGRGVYLMKKLMDKVEYNLKGNKVLMVKKITRGRG